MLQIPINDAFRALISDPNSEAAFCDERGNLLGYYVPVKQATAEDYAWAKSQFPPEELERLRQQTGGRSLQEIMRDLERMQ